MTRGAPRHRRPPKYAVRRGRFRAAAATIALVAAGSLTYATAGSSAAAGPPLTVTATSSPASGTTVHAGDTVTYTLRAVSPQPLTEGATVVDDLSGLLTDARVVTSPEQLAKSGLTLDRPTGRLTWALPPSTPSGGDGSPTGVSFRVVVSATARAGATLHTAAAGPGETCAAGSTCATTLTVTGPTESSPPTVPPSLARTPPGSSGPSGPSGPPSSSTTPPASSPPASSPTPTRPVVSPTPTDKKPVTSPDPSATKTGGASRRRAAAAAAAAPCTGAVPVPGSPLGGFELDGNQCTDNSGDTDWDGAGTQPRANDGAADSTQFAGGASENNWPWSHPQTEGAAAAPSKADITNVYATTRTVGDVFAYVGFRRLSNSGSVAYHVELNHRPNVFGPVPDRTTGDLRLTIVQSGSETLHLEGTDEWNGRAWRSLGSLAGFVGQVNQSPITNLSGETLLTGTFAEVGIDLSAIFGDDCSGKYGTLNIRSSSSASENSPLGDWTDPINVTVPSTCPSLVVDKTWEIDGTTYSNGSQPAGFSAALSVTGQTAPEFGVTYPTRSDGTSYQTGESVTINETVPPLPAGCTNVASGDLGSHTLQAGLNPFKIVNTVTCTYLSLTKVVVGGNATAGQWTLSATGPTSFSGAAATAGVRKVHVAPGSYALTETGPSGYRQTSLTCRPGSATGNSVTVTAGADVTCTFTNTAVHPVVLTKAWHDAVAGDTVDLTLTDSTATATGTSTAPSTTTNATLDTLVGDTVGVAETFTTGDRSQYVSTVECDSDVTVSGGSFTVPTALAAGTPIRCTFTNARRSATLTLQKSWVHGAFDDTADLSIDGATSGTRFARATVPPGADGLSSETASTTVFAGDTVDLAEAFGAGNTGTYDATLACAGPARLTYTAGALSGTYAVPSTPDDVTCTFTNTRTSAQLTLQKTWVDGAAGDQAGLSITGSDAGTAGSATSTASGAAGSETDTGHRATATIFSGATVTVSEELPPAGHTNAGSYASTISCSTLATHSGKGGQAASGVVPDHPVPALCTVTNTRTSASLTLQKRWVNGAAADTTDLAIDGATDGAGFATAEVPAGGSGLSIDRAATVLLSGQTIDLAETLGAAGIGSYTAEIVCDRPGLTPDGDGRGGTYQVPASPEAVTCTITNTRTSADLILRKTWVNGATGDMAELAVNGADPPSFGTATTVATGVNGSETDTANQATAAILSGATVSVSEVLPPTGQSNIGSYSSQISCDQPGLTPDGDGRGGSFTVPDTPVAVTCTITNTRTSTLFTLRKEWINGATSDTAALSVNGQTPTTSAAATSESIGAGGSQIDDGNPATARAYSGQVLSLAEEMGAANTGSYTSRISCDEPGLTPDADEQGGRYQVPAAAAAVTCTVSNTRTSAMLTLRKRWVDGAAGDTADLAISGTDAATAGTATSTATGETGSEIDTANEASAAIFSGGTVHLAETVPSAGQANVGTYTASITCDEPGVIAAGNGAGGTLVVPDVPVPVTCTITNTRTSAALTLQKDWVDGAVGDTARLAISGSDAAASGEATSTATGANGSEVDTGATATATILSGQTIDLAETPGSDNTGSYTAEMSCDQPGLTPSGDGRSGRYQVPALPAPTTCTVRNIRTSARLILQKTWTAAAAGDTTELSITGGGPEVTQANTSTASGAAGTETDGNHQAIATVHSGQALVLGEAFGANTGSYVSDLTCSDDATLTYDANSKTGIYVVPAEPAEVTCTFTNTRTSATITLQKTWVNAADGDTAELSVSGSNPGTAGSARSIASGAPGAETDSANTVIAPIFSGETVDLVEELGDSNRGSYSSVIACDPAGGLDPGDGGQGGSYEVPAIPVEVTCTITNSRTSAILVLQKSWVNGALGDTADLAIDGATSGPGFATAAVPVTANGLSVDKATTTLLSGESVDLAETPGGANSAVYATQIACDQPGLTPDAEGNGGTYHVPASPVAVTCTITNTGPVTGPAGALTVTKSVTSNVQQANGSWTVRYAIAVSNPVTAPLTRYTLSDTLAFGAGITVNTASTTGPDDETVNPSWDGSTDTIAVLEGTADTGETDDYTVTVNATVTSSATSADRTCSAGGGFLNQASIGLAVPPAAPAAGRAPAATSTNASACAQPASPAISKFGNGAAPHPGDSTWDITYSLSVANPSATTGLRYDLTDTPAFPTGATVNTATVIAAHDSAGQPITGLVNTWNGTTLSIVAGRELAADVTDTFTVRVNALVTGAAQSSLACVGDLQANGFFNTASAAAGEDRFSANGCVAIPPAAITGGSTGSPGGSGGSGGSSASSSQVGGTGSSGSPGSSASDPVASTGVPIAQLVAEAASLVALGVLLQLIFRRRRRPA